MAHKIGANHEERPVPAKISTLELRVLKTFLKNDTMKEGQVNAWPYAMIVHHDRLSLFE